MNKKGFIDAFGVVFLVLTLGAMVGLTTRAYKKGYLKPPGFCRANPTECVTKSRVPPQTAYTTNLEKTVFTTNLDMNFASK